MTKVGGQTARRLGSGAAPRRGGGWRAHRLHESAEARPHGGHAIGRQPGQQRHRRVEHGRERHPGRHVVFGIAFGLERRGTNRRHDEHATAIVVERFAEHSHAVGKPAGTSLDGGGQRAGLAGERRHGRLHGCELGGHIGRREPRRLSERFGQIEQRPVDVLAARLASRRGELGPELPPGPGGLFEELHEPRAPDRVVGRAKRELSPGDIGPPELVDLRVDTLERELASVGTCRPPPLVNLHEPRPQRFAVGDVRRGGIFEPPHLSSRGLEDGQPEELPHLLVLGDQKRHVLPGLRSGEPVEEQLVGLPAHDGLAGAGRQLRCLRVGDRLDMPPGERIERHDAAVFEHGNLPPCREGRMQPRCRRLRGRERRGGRDEPPGKHGEARRHANERGHQVTPGWRRGPKK